MKSSTSKTGLRKIIYSRRIIINYCMVTPITIPSVNLSRDF